ncbi:hypothetical protein KFE25_000325 [Diacronema lutheri]|uniref:[F-actin]-monooxygenase MICAL1-3-like Rossman domain-containing protein n=1 Tax=Diacronema lutheri TaxID=2081491 RepID=A0A8J5XNM1_DIALT|nr:hypothetical protein KFE25_000325 [Diacronema lutheri]
MTSSVESAAWNAFVMAAEVCECEAAFAQLLAALGVDAALRGNALFDAIGARTAASACPFRTKELVKSLGAHWARRPAPPEGAPLRVLVSGAGPVGLRMAVECAMLGMDVRVVERRATFSRVNILTLWQQTADDLAAFGAKLFNPAFSVHGEPLHLGTREIQLTLLKAAMLMGVGVSYRATLRAVQHARRETTGARPLWTAWVHMAAESDGGSAAVSATRADDDGATAAVAFKPRKDGAYSRGALQGRLNAMAPAQLDESFALGPGAATPAACEPVEFEALCLAEGEWSDSCRRLGVRKAIDRFGNAIGLVANLHAHTPAPRALRSFVCAFGLGEPIQTLTRGGLPVENLEYLRGSTHYCAATVPKAALLARGALRADAPAAELLAPANVDVERLRALGRTVASACGVPADAPLCAQHGVQLFDFSSRARALCPFRLLALDAAGERAIALDVEGQPTLATARTSAHERELDAAELFVRERAEGVSAAQAALDGARLATVGVSGAPIDEDEREAVVAYHAAQLHRAEEQAATARDKLDARHAEFAEWKALISAARGASACAVVLPLGDALLEPFWPQGLGTNRGFHGALDGAWALRCHWSDGLDACLIERAFTYDALLADFARARVLPGGGWTADPLHRYHPDVLKGLMRSYQDPSAKRWFKGTGAIPRRYAHLTTQALGAQRAA